MRGLRESEGRASLPVLGARDRRVARGDTAAEGAVLE